MSEMVLNYGGDRIGTGKNRRDPTVDDLIFYPENGGRRFARKVANLYNTPQRPVLQDKIFLSFRSNGLKSRIEMTILHYYSVTLRRSKLSHLRKPTGLWSSSASIFSTHPSGDQIEKNEMGRACSAYGGEEKRIQGFGGET
jgi:hypothetical protein